MLENRKILVGVTGSIAAYKAAILIRMLVKEKAEVKVIMTPLAKAFITPLTLATLSKNPSPAETMAGALLSLAAIVAIEMVMSALG